MLCVYKLNWLPREWLPLTCVLIWPWRQYMTGSYDNDVYVFIDLPARAFMLLVAVIHFWISYGLVFIAQDSVDKSGYPGSFQFYFVCTISSSKWLLNIFLCFDSFYLNDWWNIFYSK